MDKYKKALEEYFLDENKGKISERQFLSGILSFSETVKNPDAAACKVLAKFPSFDSILYMSCTQISAESGIDLDAAFLIKLVAEASMRQRVEAGIGKKIECPKDACRFFEETYRGTMIEEFRVVCLNDSLRIIDYAIVSRGNLTKVTCDEDILLNKVKSSGCPMCIIVHNHPGVSNEPSSLDISTTKRLYSLLDCMGVRLLEHVIIGENGAACIINDGTVGSFSNVNENILKTVDLFD